MKTDPQALPLRDIHLPDPVSFWPPAPGWWLLCGIVVAAAIAAFYMYHRNRRLKVSAVNQARAELQDIIRGYSATGNQTEAIRKISVLLRRLSISLFPRAETASLTGQEWLVFLDRQMEGNPFSRGAGRILAEAPYRPDITDSELESLFQHCHDWIDAVSRIEAGRK